MCRVQKQKKNVKCKNEQWKNAKNKKTQSALLQKIGEVHFYGCHPASSNGIQATGITFFKLNINLKSFQKPCLIKQGR